MGRSRSRANCIEEQSSPCPGGGRRPGSRPARRVRRGWPDRPSWKEGKAKISCREKYRVGTSRAKTRAKTREHAPITRSLFTRVGEVSEMRCRERERRAGESGCRRRTPPHQAIHFFDKGKPEDVVEPSQSRRLGDEGKCAPARETTQKTHGSRERSRSPDSSMANAVSWRETAE